MFDQPLLDAFNHCVDMLAAGQSIQDCLQAYPEYAAQLAPMLEAGRTAVRAQPAAAEVAAAQQRVSVRFEHALRAPAPRPAFPLRQLAALAAALMLVCGFVLSGTMVAAQDSLPGDFLYPFKQLSEDLRLALPGDDAGLQAQFDQRRIDETVDLLALQREAEVTFAGDITGIEEAAFMVAGLRVQVSADTPGSDLLAAGRRVQVRARTTTDGQLIGLTIQPVDRPESPAGPPAATNTPLPTAQPSATPSPTATLSPTVTDTASPTITPTMRRTPTAPGPSSSPPGSSHTPVMGQSATPGGNHSQTPGGPGGAAATPTANTAGQTAPGPCTPVSPAGWVSYLVQSGDSLAALVPAEDAPLQQIIRVNCLGNPPWLLVGSEIYLPAGWFQTPTPSDPDQGSGGPGPGSDGGDPGSGPGDGGGSGPGGGGKPG